MVFWVWDLIALATKRQLQEIDVWDCPSNQSVEHDARLVLNSWEAEKKDAAAQGRRPTVGRSLFRAFRADIVNAAFFQVYFMLSQLGQPYLVGALVSFVVTGNGGLANGIGLALALLVVSLSSSLSLAHTLFLFRRLGVAVRSGVMAAVYSHSLALTASSRFSMGIGTITSLMVIDSEKLFLAFQFMNFLWHGPVSAIIVMCLLIPEMGFFSALAGGAWIAVLIPLQIWVAGSIGRVRRKMISKTDERVKLTNEILSSIRAIKIYGWEVPIHLRVLAERSKELAQLQVYLLNSSYLRELLFAAGPIATIIIFSVHLYAQREAISVSQVFRVLAFINILRFPLNLLGQALKCFADATVSVQRLDRFLCLPVLATCPPCSSEDASTAAAALPYISIDDTSFTWDSLQGEKDVAEKDGSTGFLLQNITFHSKNSPAAAAAAAVARPGGCQTGGELVAIIGAVGSGKSTLFSAILNELSILRAPSDTSVQRVGAIAYCAQSPWIQNLSLKSNVMFGIEDIPALQGAYQQAITAAALQPDISILPHGDDTEIGERGINLSGGQKARVSIARALLAAITGQSSIILLDDPLSAVDSTTAQHIFTNGILGLCRDKLVLVALNSHLHMLGQFDRVLVMDGGRIVCNGTLQEVWQTERGREVLAQAGLSEGVDPNPNRQAGLSERAAGSDVADVAVQMEVHEQKREQPELTLGKIEKATEILDTAATKALLPSKVLIRQETRAVGAVSHAVYLNYFASGFTSIPALT